MSVPSDDWTIIDDYYTNEHNTNVNLDTGTTFLRSLGSVLALEPDEALDKQANRINRLRSQQNNKKQYFHLKENHVQRPNPLSETEWLWLEAQLKAIKSRQRQEASQL